MVTHLLGVQHWAKSSAGSLQSSQPFQRGTMTRGTHIGQTVKSRLSLGHLSVSHDSRQHSCLLQDRQNTVTSEVRYLPLYKSGWNTGLPRAFRKNLVCLQGLESPVRPPTPYRLAVKANSSLQKASRLRKHSGFAHGAIFLLGCLSRAVISQ